MKTKIKEVQDYFKSELLKGNFKVLTCDEFHLRVSIDTTFIFYIWIKNGEQCRRTVTTPLTQSFMDLEFTTEESKQLFIVTEPIVSKLLHEAKLEADKIEFNNLKNKYGWI